MSSMWCHHYTATVFSVVMVVVTLKCRSKTQELFGMRENTTVWEESNWILGLLADRDWFSFIEADRQGNDNYLLMK